MTTSRRIASRSLLFLFASLVSGCSVEEPYPDGTIPPAPSTPYSVRDVIKFLNADIPEDVIIAVLRPVGIDAGPTAAEIRELQSMGASNRLIAWLLAAAVTAPLQVPGDDRLP